MKYNQSMSQKIFFTLNYLFIALVTFLCIMPLIHVLAVSFSSSAYAEGGVVTFFPVGFTLAAYKFVIHNMKFWTSCIITFKRLLIGIPLGLFLTILTAYPLSKEVKQFPARKIYIKIFIFVMIFNGGLVPTYLLVRQLNLIDTIWALVLPSGINVFNVVILMNFFRNIPKEIEESALVDGANQMTILLKLMLPLSKPSLATILLFVFMFHWNSWMDGRIYMNMVEHYPLQTYLQGVLAASNSSLLNTSNVETILDKMKVGGMNLRAAMLFLSMIPVLIAYPFLQKYFVSGLVVGSVKG